MKRTTTVRSRILVSVLAAVTGLIAAELLVRRMDRRRAPPAQEVSAPAVRPSPDPRLRFENRPGSRFVLRYFAIDGGIEREVVASINEQGFRGDRVDEVKPPGTCRIVVIGDSQTFGTGVDDGETWPAVLERELASQVKDRRIEVMNCAVAGYDSEQETAALESQWLAYRPDLVLLGYFLNDPTLPGTGAGTSTSWSRWLMPLLVPRRDGFLGNVRRHSELVDFILDGLYRRVRIEEWARGGTALHRDDGPGWIRTRSAITRDRDLCLEHGARFAVVLLPFVVRYGSGLVSTEAYRKVQTFCSQSGIPSLDLEPAFAGLDLGDMLVHERDLHSGPQAHRIEGRAVSRWILDRELLSGNRR